MIPVKAAVVALAALVTVAPGNLHAQENNASQNSASQNNLSQHNVSAKTVRPAAALNGQHEDSDRPALQRRNPRYQVHADDILSITFPLCPEFDQLNVMVQPDGYISLQGAESLYVQGMTAPEIGQALKKSYAGTLHDPIVAVDIIDFQRPFFLVSGQVGKPGEYDLRHETTVSEAIAMAGGFAPTAKTQVFLFHRVSSGWVEVRRLSLKDILNGKNVNEDAQMSSGDMLFVPEKFITNFRKYVPYAITGSTGTYLTNP